MIDYWLTIGNGPPDNLGDGAAVMYQAQLRAGARWLAFSLDLYSLYVGSRSVWGM